MTAATDTRAFADRMVTIGIDLGYSLGLKRANEILRAHGIDPVHPVRVEIFNALMTERPQLPVPATPAAA
jgi:hypothetical protein